MGGAYEKALVPRFARRGADGRDRAQTSLVSAGLEADGGAPQTLTVPDGSTVLRIPDGAASIRYTLTVQARYQKNDGNLKNLTFTYTIRYSGDVSLELQYTLSTGAQTTIRCANGQNKTAQTVYSDELTEGLLPFTLTLTVQAIGVTDLTKLVDAGGLTGLAGDQLKLYGILLLSGLSGAGRRHIHLPLARRRADAGKAGQDQNKIRLSGVNSAKPCVPKKPACDRYVSAS